MWLVASLGLSGAALTDTADRPSATGNGTSLAAFIAGSLPQLDNSEAARGNVPIGVASFPATAEIAYPHSSRHADNLLHGIASPLMLNRVPVSSVLFPVDPIGGMAEVAIEPLHSAEYGLGGNRRDPYILAASSACDRRQNITQVIT